MMAFISLLLLAVFHLKQNVQHVNGAIKYKGNGNPIF